MEKNTITSDQREEQPNGLKTSNKKGLIIGIVAAAFVVIVGVVTWFLHRGNESDQNKIEDARQKRIEIHIGMSKKCDKIISDLNWQSIEYKLDDAIEQMCALEEFEADTIWVEDTPIVVDRKLLPEKMKSFRGKLADIHDYLENSLTELEGFDKQGDMYQGRVHKIELIDAVCYEIDNCETKSAKCIHVRSEDF